MTERELITYCLENNAAYQRQLVQKYSSTLFAICLRYCKSREDAKDCLQESWITIFKNIKKYEFLGSFEGWIKRITVNCALQQYRKKDLIKRTESVAATPLQDVEPGVISELNTQEILDLLKQLPDIKRIVFTMYVVEGYSHAEISELVGIAESSSRSILTRTRQELKKIIRSYDKAIEL